MNTPNLKELRQAAHMTQQEVAEALGMKQSAYNRIENGKVSTRWETMQAILDLLKSKK